MNQLDYQKLGFKAGLEVHQQLDTNKLFCNCPSLLRKDEPDFEIKRKLHAVAGESGKVDVAAEYQSSLNKEFVYQGYDTTCLVELDEEPPHEINKEALRIALQISILLNTKIVPLSQIMRKTVIDGSNTSGFQRTVMIARNGYIETEQGRVGIEGIFLEEDAARIVDKTDNKVIYRLDRLGIPLVEIVTAPDIKTPEQAKEVSLKLGEILRSCKVKRGIGTIRQDVSISIRGGKRIEMKGVQEPKLIISTINHEIERQLELVKKKLSKPEVRRGNPDSTTSFLRPLPGSARMYPETDLPLLKISRYLINEIKKSLPKLRTEIEEELKKKRLTDELIKLVLEGHLDNFKSLLEVYPKDPLLVAKMLTLWRREVASKLKEDFSVVEERINMDVLENILEKMKKGELSKNNIKPLFSDLMKGVLLEDAIKVEKIDNPEIEEKVMKIVKDKPGLSEKAYMGLVMKEFRGKIDGRKAMEIIKKFVK